MNNSVEDDIFGNIPGLDTDEVVEGDQDDQGKEQNKFEEELGNQFDNAKANEGVDSAGNDVDGVGKQGNNQGERGDVSNPDNNNRRPGDLVDQESGDVIAQQGAGRRIYEKALKERDDLRLSNAKYEATIATLNEPDALMSQYGLTADQRTPAIQLYAAFQKDPKATVQSLLTHLQKDGISIEGISDGTNVNAIKAMIDEKLAPLTAERNAKLEETKVYEEVNKTVSTFFESYPDAVVQEEIIAKAMNEYPGNTLQDVWAEIRIEAVKRGFDLNKPLLAQAMAEEEAKPAVEASKLNQPLPQGKGSTGINLSDKSSPTVYANESTSFKDIIRGAVADVGGL